MWKRFKSIEYKSGKPSFAADVAKDGKEDAEFLSQFIWYDKRGQYLRMEQFEAKKDGKPIALAAGSKDIVVTGYLTSKTGNTIGYTVREVIDIQYDSETADIWLETPQVGILLRDPLPSYASFCGALKYGFKMLAKQLKEDRKVADMLAANEVPIPPPRTFETLPGGTKMGDDFAIRFPPIDVNTATAQSGAYSKDMTTMLEDRAYFGRFVLQCDRGQYLYMTQVEARRKGKMVPIVAPSKDIAVFGNLANFDGELLTFTLHEVTAVLYDLRSEDLWLETPMGAVLLREPEKGYEVFFTAMKNAHKAAGTNGAGAFIPMQ